MIAKSSVLQEATMSSPLTGFSTLRPKGAGWKKNIVSTLMLTSLVDAFSILVIYLLINFSSGEIITVSKDMELPPAAEVTEIVRNIVIKIESDGLYLENKRIPAKALVASLIEEKKRMARENTDQEVNVGSITIQADRRIKYREINSVILAGSHAGFSDIHFAVLEK